LGPDLSNLQDRTAVLLSTTLPLLQTIYFSEKTTYRIYSLIHTRTVCSSPHIPGRSPLLIQLSTMSSGGGFVALYHNIMLSQGSSTCSISHMNLMPLAKVAKALSWAYY
jgi:hypothetical protein